MSASAVTARRAGRALALAIARFSLASPAVGLSIDLLPDTFSPVRGEVVEFTIRVTLEPEDSLTGAVVTVDAMGATFVDGTEQPFNFVNGVQLTPIGTPGHDLGPVLGDPDRIGGWEATIMIVPTPDPTAATGPAVFAIGSARYRLDRHTVWLTMSTSIGDPGGTIVGGADLRDQTHEVRFGEFHLPEPTIEVLLGCGLLGCARRRRPEPASTSHRLPAGGRLDTHNVGRARSSLDESKVRRVA